MLPLLRALPDEIGSVVFVSLHVPLFAALIALVASSDPPTRLYSQLGIAAFLVIHGLLHFLFMGHPNDEFSSVLSEILIFGGAALGLTYLALEGRELRAASAE